MNQTTLRVYTDLDDLNALRSAWDDLLNQFPTATTFSTWEWLTSWWQNFGQNRQLVFLAVFDSGLLIGLAPLSISKERFGKYSLRVLRMMGDGSNDSDNLDFPVRSGFEKTFSEIIIRYLKQQKQQWDICLLNTLPADSLVAGPFAKILTSSGWTFFEYPSQCSAVPLPDSWDLYLQMLASEDRKNLARYTRRLQTRYSTRIYRCSDSSELPSCLEALFRLHQDRWKSAGQPGSFSLPERRKFYIELSQHLFGRGCLELWALKLDGEIVAVQFAFRHGDRVFQLQEGYDHARSSDRVGYVLRGAVLKQLISEKARSYDLLGGEDPYKARWGARTGQYRNLHFAPSLGIGSCCLQLVDKTNRSKNWLRQRLPRSAWKVLHTAHLTIRGKFATDQGSEHKGLPESA